MFFSAPNLCTIKVACKSLSVKLIKRDKSFIFRNYKCGSDSFVAVSGVRVSSVLFN